jgi:hypothetical protein
MRLLTKKNLNNLIFLTVLLLSIHILLQETILILM